MNVADLFRRQASSRPLGEALRCGDLALTWSQVDRRTDALATALIDRFETGERIALLAINCHRYAESHAACSKAGLITVPINHRLTPVEVTQILDDVDARGIIFDARLADDLAVVLDRFGDRAIVFGRAIDGACDYETLASGSVATPPDRRHDINVVGFTSGTTGRARGAILTQHIATTSGFWFAHLLGLDARSSFLACMPAYVYRGQASMLAPVISGARTIALPFDAGAVLAAIAKHRVTHVIFAPAMVDRLLAHPDMATRDLSSLQSIWIGGAPTSPAVVQQLGEQVHADIGSVYGMTEATGIASMRWNLDESDDEVARNLASVGRTGALLDVRLVRDDGSDAGDDEVGEVTVHGDSLMQGYWGVPPDETFVDGWYPTGDMATRDATGRLFLIDRRADIIVSGGLNVYAAEVEQLVGEHPAVMSCAIVSAPDPTWGETVVAVVVVRPGAALTLAELDQHCNARLARFKHPRRLVIIDELPANAMGKVNKKLLREQLWAGRANSIG